MTLQADAAPTVDASLDWHDNDYAARKKVTLRPPTSVTVESIANYPAAIRIVADDELASAGTGDGIDLKFAVVGGGVVAHEIESFDAATGELVAWVSIPELSLTGPTEIYLYYDSDNAVSIGDPSAVFGAPFVGVWHLANDPNGLAPQMLDSTSGENHGSVVGAATPSSVAGIMGPALEFDGIDDNVTVPDAADDSLDAAMDSFTYSLWVRAYSSVGQFDIVIYKGGAIDIQPGYDMQLGSGSWSGKCADGVADYTTLFGPELEFLDVWTNLAVVIDRDTDEVRTYANGDLTGTSSVPGLGSLSNDRALELSRTIDPLNGIIDEVRLYRGVRSLTFLGVTHANIRSPDVFASVGAEERR